MILSELRLINFRNYPSLKLELPQAGALFIGQNGSGKTNLLESISLLILGRSCRGASIKQLIQHGSEESFVGGTLLRGGVAKEQSIGISRAGKISLKKDGEVSSTLSRLYGEGSFVYIGPLDINLITGSPIERRAFIDITLSQQSSLYLSSLMEYKRTLSQRNSLLSKGCFDTLLCEIYDKKLAESAHYLIQQRREFTQSIDPLIRDIYKNISSDGLIPSIGYNSSIKSDTVEGIVDEFRQRVDRDRELRYTSIGPQRDDIAITSNRRAFSSFASQGQCRSVALALKIATIHHLQANSQSDPIIAIDDAFSDLDESRKSAFYETLESRGQIFMALHTKRESQLYNLPAFNIREGEIG